MIKTIYKKIVFAILLTVNAWILSIGQDSVEFRIKEIQTECEKINKEIKKLKMTETDVNGLSAEGGTLKRFFYSNTLKKASLTFFGETGQSTTDYYFLNGNLIHVNKQVEMYKLPLGMGKVEAESIETNKFFFDHQKLIRWINNESEIADPASYSQKEKEILDDLRIIL